MGEKCYNGGSKHNFEPRYDEVPSGYEWRSSYPPPVAEDLKNLTTHKKYVKDICTWCGKGVLKKEREVCNAKGETTTNYRPGSNLS